MNASDVRSKKALEDTVADLLTNAAVTQFYGAKSSSSAASDNEEDDDKPRPGQKSVLVMDEVDGMRLGRSWRHRGAHSANQNL